MNENTYKICLRLTLQERAKLEADAKLCGLTKSALLRRMISGLEVKARPRNSCVTVNKEYSSTRRGKKLSIRPPLACAFLVCVVPKEE